MTRYLLAVPFLALLGAAPAPPAIAPKARPTNAFTPLPSTCAPIGSVAEGEKGPPRLRRLGDLPPAEAYMAVLRTDEKGCLDPLLARDRQGIRRR